MKTWTNPIAATLAILLTLTACQDTPDVATAPDVEPGEPAAYAPPSWPYQIGDTVPHSEFEGLRETFSFFGPIGHALHLVGDDVYAAKWDWDTLRGHIYEGHFPARDWPWRDDFSGNPGMPAYLERLEEMLPEQFHGTIHYASPVVLRYREGHSGIPAGSER